MGNCFLYGAGGTSLNFKVVSNPQPSSPAENTIWVDTDKINNYHFSANQPTDMADYDVWFSIGTSSPVKFNALKKNAVQVYPLNANQMVSGALVKVTAKIYQNGEWEQFIPVIVLFDGGDNSEVTGGWHDYSTNSNYQKLTLGETLSLSNSSSDQSGFFVIKNAFNLTDYNTLFCKCINGGSANIKLYISSSVSSDMVSYVALTAAIEHELDISSLSGQYFIGLYIKGQSGVTISNLEIRP